MSTQKVPTSEGSLKLVGEYKGSSSLEDLDKICFFIDGNMDSLLSRNELRKVDGKLERTGTLLVLHGENMTHLNSQVNDVQTT